MVWREYEEELCYGVVEVLLEEKPRPLDAVIEASGPVLLSPGALTNLTKYQDLSGKRERERGGRGRERERDRYICLSAYMTLYIYMYVYYIMSTL